MINSRVGSHAGGPHHPAGYQPGPEPALTAGHPENRSVVWAAGLGFVAETVVGTTEIAINPRLVRPASRRAQAENGQTAQTGLFTQAWRSAGRTG